MCLMEELSLWIGPFPPMVSMFVLTELLFMGLALVKCGHFDLEDMPLF